MATMFESSKPKNKKKPGLIFQSILPRTRRRQIEGLLPWHWLQDFPSTKNMSLAAQSFQRAKGRLLRLSNARASTAGALAAGDDGAPGRPTLKRRQPTPDDSTTNPDTGEQKSGEQAPPKLKKNDGQNRQQP